MGKKDYDLVINEENLREYRELYEAKSDLDDNNQLKLLIVNTISLAAGGILSVFLIKNMPNELAQFMPLSMFATSLPTSFLAYNIIKRKQIKSLREEYPYINIDIPKNIIKKKLEDYNKQKELSNIDEKVVEKTTEDITDDIMIKTCDIARGMTINWIKDEISEINLGENNTNVDIMNVSLSDEIEILKRKREILEAMIEVKECDEAKKYNLSIEEDKK